MAELLHNFTSGKMNKDYDERIVPNGEYRDALNLEVTNSDGSNVGALQNIRGNIELSNKNYNVSTGVFTPWSTNYISALSNPICVGKIVDNTTEKLYWLIASQNVSAIAEYDQIKNLITPIIVDTQNILKFSPDYLITGINIIQGILFWTDYQTEPKSLNIKKWRELNTPDFLTHTQIFGRPFEEQDITVIRKKPLTALNMDMSSSARGGAGTGITPLTTEYPGAIMVNGATTVNFTYRPDPLEVNTYATIPSLNAVNSALPGTYPPALTGKVTIITQPAPANYRNLDNIILTTTIIQGDGSPKEYKVRLQVRGPLDSNGNLLPGNTLACDIQSIPSDLPRGLVVYQWKVLLEESNPIYNLVFPRFSYRWKYSNNNVSAMAPFSEVAFVGDAFKYLSSDGYNLGMVNNLRQLILKDINWGSEDVTEVELLFKQSDTDVIYSLAKLKRSEGLVYTYDVKNEIVGAALGSNQILRPYDNVPRIAKAQEMAANRLIYGNYLQQYNLNPPTITAGILINYRDPIANPVGKPLPSLKSLRTYQLGLVYLDAYGRETPVFSSNASATTVPVLDAPASTSLRVSVQNTSQIPTWATHFKYFIKENSNEYYNLALDRFYYAEDGNIWLSFPSSERNKLEVDTYIILKKQHNTSLPVTAVNKYKVLAIKNEAPAFIATTTINVATAVCLLIANPPVVGSLAFNVFGPSSAENYSFSTGVNSSRYITINYGTDITQQYRIASGGPDGSNNYTFRLTTPLGNEAAFLNGLPGGTPITINIIENKVESKAEFEGRFFAKINLDAVFQTNVIDPFGDRVQYGSTGAVSNIDRFIINTAPEFGGSDARNTAWLDAFKGQYDQIDATAIIPYEPFRYTKAPTVGGSYPRTFGFAIAGYWDDYSPEQAFPDSVTPGSLIRFIGRNGKIGNVIYRIEKKNTYVDQRRADTFSESAINWGPVGSNIGRYYQFKLNKNFIPEPLFGAYTSSEYTSNANIIVGFQRVEVITASNNKVLASNNPAVFETEPKPSLDLKLFYQASDAFPIEDITTLKTLKWFNCYSYGNGVESNRIRDDFNAVTIDKGPIVSSTLDVPYQEEYKTSSMIYSGIFNSVSGVNNLNQFIQAEAITKDLNPYYGSIQALLARDTDLITFCEDKILNVLANKDALYNAGGNSQLTSTSNVLGQATPYVGEFGISKNPESLASYGFRAYFTDKARGVVLRLSRDGIEPISDKGMRSFFLDNFPICSTLIGSFNDRKGSYNLTLSALTNTWQNILATGQFDRTNPDCTDFVPEGLVTQTTIAFKENADGWTSRMSFIQEAGCSLNSVFYTFKEGLIWEHDKEKAAPFNNFYGIQYDCSVNVLINDAPEMVKGFKTINYSGSRQKEYIYQNGDGHNYSIAQIQANHLMPTSFSTKQGWHVNYIHTDLQEGQVKELIKKEGKYFNYIRGLQTFFNTNCDNNVNAQEFAVQGIGRPSSITGATQTTKFAIHICVDPEC